MITFGQYAAVGKHAMSYAAGGVTAAVAFHFLSPSDAAGINEGLGHIASGAEEMAKGIAGIIAVLTPIYTALRAAHNAAPKQQLAAVVSNLSAPEVTQVANAVADPEGRKKLINAVAEMPEVQKIVAAPVVAQTTPSPKVVTQ